MSSKRLFKKVSKLLFEVFKYGCIANCVLECCGSFVMTTGASMEPTIYSGDILLTEHLLSYFVKVNFERNDIVVVRSPHEPKEFICKRILHLPGDIVNNGRNSIKIPKGHVWLAGDNARCSLDSRTYGPVPMGLIRSRVVYKLWPFTDFGMLRER